MRSVPWPAAASGATSAAEARIAAMRSRHGRVSTGRRRATDARERQVACHGRRDVQAPVAKARPQPRIRRASKPCMRRSRAPRKRAGAARIAARDRAPERRPTPPRRKHHEQARTSFPWRSSLGAASFATAAQELRLSTFVPPVHVIYREILTPWAEEVAKATNGAGQGDALSVDAARRQAAGALPADGRRRDRSHLHAARLHLARLSARRHHRAARAQGRRPRRHQHDVGSPRSLSACRSSRAPR